MVGARPRRPCAGRQRHLGALDDVPHGAGIEGRSDEVEVEGQPEFVVPVAVVRSQLVQWDRGLPDQEPGLVVAVRQAAPAPDHIVNLGPVGVVDTALPEHLRLEVVVLGGRRVVPQLGVLDDDVADVDAEPGHAPVGPEAENAVEGVAHLVVPPIEVRLLGQVVVEEVLPGPLVERPPRTAEATDPVVRWSPSRRAVGPEVPVATGRGSRGPRLEEPRVLVAGVVGHDVHEDPDAPRPRLGNEPVEVVQRAELGRDGAEVGDVVAPVGVGRRSDRREPDAIDAEPLQVVQMPDDPGDVAHSVGVAVGERPGVDLIEDATLPPGVAPRSHGGGPGSAEPRRASRQGERSSSG